MKNLTYIQPQSNPKSILEPTPFQYKGTKERIAETKRRLEKKYNMAALKAAFERGIK